MGSSIFADESGDESARERRTVDGRRSIFRQHDGEPGVEAAGDGEGVASSRDGEQVESGGDEGGESASGDDGSEAGTMTVFSGDEVFEIAINDE